MCWHRFIVADCQNSIAMPGQYSFPFEVILPANLPASVNLKLGVNHAAIEYFFVAKFQPTNYDKQLDYISSKRPVRIHEA
jgi:hypothetical protein